MIHAGDIGTKIRIDIDSSVGLVEALESKIHYKKPNGEAGEWNATIVDSGLEYTTVDGDIDVPGQWKIQGFLDLADWSGTTKVMEFTVERAL